MVSLIEGPGSRDGSISARVLSESMPAIQGGHPPLPQLPGQQHRAVADWFFEVRKIAEKSFENVSAQIHNSQDRARREFLESLAR